MAEKYIIRVQGELVEVTEEVYRAYYGIERHLLTLDEKDERNGKTLYSNLDTKETLGEEMIPDIDAISVEDAAISRILHEQLRQALTLLTPAEQKLIKQIYFQNCSERQVSKESGVPYMTVHNRKVRILKKLFNMLK
jgi:RNA polymerase sigma factor (sigma-70 family)